MQMFPNSVNYAAYAWVRPIHGNMISIHFQLIRLFNSFPLERLLGTTHIYVTRATHGTNLHKRKQTSSSGYKLLSHS